MTRRARGHRNRTLPLAVSLAVAVLALGGFAPRAVSGGEGSPYVQVNDDYGDTDRDFPSIAVDSMGTVYLAWQDERNGDTDIYFAKSSDKGGNWTHPNVRVNSDPGTVTQLRPVIAVDSSRTVYLAWMDSRDGGPDLYFAKSTDGGSTWTHPNSKVNTDAGSSGVTGLDLAVGPSGSLYLSWSDSRSGYPNIYFAKSTDGGSSWTTPNSRVDTSTGGEWRGETSIAVDKSGTIYVAWADDRNGVMNTDVYFARSTDGGVTWTNPDIKVNTDGEYVEQGYPTLAADDNGVVYVAWDDQRNGTSDVFFAKSENGGLNWTFPNLMVNDAYPIAGQFRPDIALDRSGTIYLAWEDSRGTLPGVYYAKSPDGGATWTHPNTRLGNGLGGRQSEAVFGVDTSGNVYLAWGNDVTYSSDIYCTRVVSVAGEPGGEPPLLGLPFDPYVLGLLIILGVVIPSTIYALYRRRK